MPCCANCRRCWWRSCSGAWRNAQVSDMRRPAKWRTRWRLAAGRLPPRPGFSPRDSTATLTLSSLPAIVPPARGAGDHGAGSWGRQWRGANGGEPGFRGQPPTDEPAAAGHDAGRRRACGAAGHVYRARRRGWWERPVGALQLGRHCAGFRGGFGGDCIVCGSGDSGAWPLWAPHRSAGAEHAGIGCPGGYSWPARRSAANHFDRVARVGPLAHAAGG